MSEVLKKWNFRSWHLQIKQMYFSIIEEGEQEMYIQK